MLRRRQVQSGRVGCSGAHQRYTASTRRIPVAPGALAASGCIRRPCFLTVTQAGMVRGQQGKPCWWRMIIPADSFDLFKFQC